MISTATPAFNSVIFLDDILAIPIAYFNQQLLCNAHGQIHKQILLHLIPLNPYELAHSKVLGTLNPPHSTKISKLLNLPQTWDTFRDNCE